MMSFVRQVLPPAYEYVDGRVIHPSLAGQSMPIPPKWVREAVNVPEKAVNATLAKEWAGNYSPGVAAKLTAYVKGWQETSYYGHDLIIYGEGSRKRLEWTAAALMNEITMRWATRIPINTQFANPGLFAWLLARDTSHDEYRTQKRNGLLTTKLLLLQEPTDLRPESDAWWLLSNVYCDRHDRKLPTIVTIPCDLSDRTGWKALRSKLHAPMYDRLREASREGNLLHIQPDSDDD